LAREISGKKWTPEAVLEEIVRDRVFFEESGGGVTFSGGEPLAQPEFLESTLRGCRREAIHTAVDTSLEAERETLQRLLPLVDLFLCDLKTFDAELHRTWTGVSNERILGNLRFLDHQGAELILRIPLVEGFNCSPDQFRQGIPFMKSLSRLRRVDLLPYHSGGEAKARRMETVPIDVPEPRRPRMGTPDEKTLVCFQKILAEHGFASVVGG
jgi:pyruvate formate lyase activating enzyme